MMLLLGLIFLALGLWAVVAWWDAVRQVLLALVALGALLLGIFLLVFAISEIAAARPAPPSSPDDHS
jgi:hypothetical protein